MSKDIKVTSIYHKKPLQDIPEVSHPGSILPIQSTTKWFVHCSDGKDGWKEVELMAQNKGVRIHQYFIDCLVRARSHQACLQHSQTLIALCQELGWAGNLEKLELDHFLWLVSAEVGPPTTLSWCLFSMLCNTC